VIVRDDGLGVPQTAHSALTGRIADAWRIDDDLPAADLRTAAAIHDLGWAAWERAPQLDPGTGRPLPFHALPPGDHAAIWTAGTDEAAAWGRWISLLVSLHCTRLMRCHRRGGDAGPEVEALVARERARQAHLREGLDDDLVERASALILTWDGLSLDLCAGKAVDLEPWPFTPDRVDLEVDARDLASPPGRPAWRPLRFTLRH
jgi:hypothetical protein